MRTFSTKLDYALLLLEAGIPDSVVRQITKLLKTSDVPLGQSPEELAGAITDSTPVAKYATWIAKRVIAGDIETRDLGHGGPVFRALKKLSVRRGQGHDINRMDWEDLKSLTQSLPATARSLERQAKKVVDWESSMVAVEEGDWVVLKIGTVDDLVRHSLAGLCTDPKFPGAAAEAKRCLSSVPGHHYNYIFIQNADSPRKFAQATPDFKDFRVQGNAIVPAVPDDLMGLIIGHSLPSTYEYLLNPPHGKPYIRHDYPGLSGQLLADATRGTLMPAVWYVYNIMRRRWPELEAVLSGVRDDRHGSKAAYCRAFGIVL